jgi:hypothetical protein
MTMAVEKIRSFRVPIRKRALLRSLQLPFDAKWDAAQPIIRQKIIKARRENRDEDAIYWSQAKEFLKRNLYRTCTCGVTIPGRQRHCMACARRVLYPQPNQKGR